jgi:hypothetical protein
MVVRTPLQVPTDTNWDTGLEVPNVPLDFAVGGRMAWTNASLEDAVERTLNDLAAEGMMRSTR